MKNIVKYSGLASVMMLSTGAIGQVTVECLPVVAVAKCTIANAAVYNACVGETNSTRSVLVVTDPLASSSAGKHVVTLGGKQLEECEARGDGLVCDLPDGGMTGTFRAKVLEFGGVDYPTPGFLFRPLCLQGFPATL